MKTPEEMRELGQRIGDYIEQEVEGMGLDAEESMTLFLTLCFGWADRLGFEPGRNPQRLFERAARVWDTLKRTQRIQIVKDLDMRDMGIPPGMSR